MSASKNRRARAIASAGVLVLALAFIVTSVWQIALAVFYEPPADARPPTPAESACSARLRTMESALERGTLAAIAADQVSSQRAAHALPETPTAAADETHAIEAFEGALTPEWTQRGAAEAACASTPRAREAWASLLRLRRGLEGRARKDAHEIGPLRRDFETRLP